MLVFPFLGHCWNSRAATLPCDITECHQCVHAVPSPTTSDPTSSHTPSHHCHRLAPLLPSISSPLLPAAHAPICIFPPSVCPHSCYYTIRSTHTPLPPLLAHHTLAPCPSLDACICATVHGPPSPITLALTILGYLPSCKHVSVWLLNVVTTCFCVQL